MSTPDQRTAREEILTRVRAAIGPGRETGFREIPRGYRATTTDGLEMFLDRLGHYDAQTVKPEDLDGSVRATLQAAGATRIVAPAGIPDQWLEHATPLRDDPPLDPDALDSSDAVLTTCAVAIAQTGTIVLDGGAGMGRRALTLLPDYHVCVVRADQIVGSVPDALTRLEPTRPLTFISGPSATVDIEMVRVGGVHGPRRLDVIVVTERPPT